MAIKDRDTAVTAEVRSGLKLWALGALEVKPELSLRHLTAELGESLGSVNYAVTNLIGQGFVKTLNFGKSAKKAANLYMLFNKSMAEKTSMITGFLMLGLEEHEILRCGIEVLKNELESRGSSTVAG